MNSSSMEFVWRRLEEPAEFLGWPLGFEPRWWVGIAIPFLILAMVWTIRNSWRESRTIGVKWAAFLGSLRALVFLLLFLVWLLPAMRQVETTTQASQVVLLFDVSASMQSSDVPPSDLPDQVRPTRQDLLLEFLDAPSARSSANGTALELARESNANPDGGRIDASSEINKSKADLGEGQIAPERDLLGGLLKRNPLFCFRFGEVLDPEPWQVTGDIRLERREWQRRLEPSPRGSHEFIDSNLIDELERTRRMLGPEGVADEDRSRLAAENFMRAWAERRRREERLLDRTNIGAALRDVLRKEANSNVQGVILFSDGRVTAGTEQDLADAAALAKKENIPVFTVGLGQPQSVPNLRLVDLLAPTRVQPEDEFPVRVVVEAESLPDTQRSKVTLKIDRPDGTSESKEETVDLAATAEAPSRGAAEFRIQNPEKLKGDWKLTARVEPIKGERTRADNVLPEPVLVKVEDRKLSVLLIASGPLRDYQFLRTLLAREPDKFEVTLWLQSAQAGTVQDVDPKRLLDRFPADLRDRDADPNNLGNYDVIVAFDPDWRAVPSLASGDRPSPQANLRTWVEQLGGGMVVIAGPVHSFSLARDPNLQTLRYLYPVILDDTAGSILQIDRLAKEPYALNWDPAATGVAFLDLLDANDPARALEGWELFFDVQRNPATGQAEGPAQRGFFSFFPLQDAKPGAQILARFGDPDPRVMTPGGQRQPFFVLSKVGKGPVFFIGSPETYRLRLFSERFHERFWTKLLRQLGKRDSARGMLVVGSRFLEGETVNVDVDLLDANLQPLRRDELVLDLRLEVRRTDGPPDARTEILLEEGVGAALRRVLASQGDSVGERTAAEQLSQLETLRQLPRFLEEPEIRGGQAGKFRFRYPARQAGRYEVVLKVPGSSEQLTGRFIVAAADPERDDVRPNPSLLFKLASSAQEIQLLDSSKREAFLQALAQTRLKLIAVASEPTGSGGAEASVVDSAQERLFFDLSTAHWIAECLDANPITYRTEGQTMDLWDKGFGVFWNPSDPTGAGGPPWALCILVSLLAVEWLSRKLLRLA